MSILTFIILFLGLVSLDVILGFLVFIFYRYMDLKYFSEFEISTLKEENSYLKKENKKVGGTSADFWSEKK